MEYFFSTQLENNKIILSKEESVHCLRVLRYRIGDKIYVTDGRGNQFFCKIDNIDNDIVKSTITDTKTTVKKSHIHIVISPTKRRQRLEWFIEKSIEIGVDEISFIECLNSERTKINLSRIEKIAITAVKQSLNTWLPKINNINKFSNIVNNISQSEKYIGYLGFEHPPYLGNLASKNSEYCLLIGPEGDFTKEEINLAIESGFSVVSLGGSRLRTETAGITGCFILNGINYE